MYKSTNSFNGARFATPQEKAAVWWLIKENISTGSMDDYLHFSGILMCIAVTVCMVGGLVYDLHDVEIGRVVIDGSAALLGSALIILLYGAIVWLTRIWKPLKKDSYVVFDGSGLPNKYNSKASKNADQEYAWFSNIRFKNKSDGKVLEQQRAVICKATETAELNDVVCVAVNGRAVYCMTRDFLNWIEEKYYEN